MLAQRGRARAGSLDTLLDVSLPVAIEFGRTHMTVQEVLELGSGSVIQLDRMVGEPIDIYVSDRKLAEGEVVVIGEHFGVRITRIVSGNEPAAARRETQLMLGAFASLLVTLGALGLALYLLRRWVPGARATTCAVPMELLRRVCTGPKQGVGLLRVGERVLVLSLGDDGARLLTELDGADRDAVIGAEPRRATAPMR